LDRHIAISDVHGCARTFEKLIFDVVALQPSDTLFLLGDYINKGPDSKGVIDIIFQLERDGYEVFSLRGNHEQYLIDAYEDGSKEDDFLSRGGFETLASFHVDSVRDLSTEYLDFLFSLGYYVELEEYLLVHAGFNFSKENLFEDEDAMLNIRVMQIDNKRIEGKKIIHGHVPTPLRSIKESLNFKKDHISIDAGCVYRHIHALNHLVALDIHDRKLYIQHNVD
jgi:serine/threonine protein phosphatase 1